MSKTISINAGSSSLKWQLYEMPAEKVIAKGLIERIGLKDSISTVKFDGRAEKQILDIDDHTQAVKILLDDLLFFLFSLNFHKISCIPISLSISTILCLNFLLLVNFFFIKISSPSKILKLYTNKSFPPFFFINLYFYPLF